MSWSSQAYNKNSIPSIHLLLPFMFSSISHLADIRTRAHTHIHTHTNTFCIYRMYLSSCSLNVFSPTFKNWLWLILSYHVLILYTLLYIPERLILKFLRNMLLLKFLKNMLRPGITNYKVNNTINNSIKMWTSFGQRVKSWCLSIEPNPLKKRC